MLTAESQVTDFIKLGEVEFSRCHIRWAAVLLSFFILLILKLDFRSLPFLEDFPKEWAMIVWQK
ncbi:hypothetical protein DW157_06605 [Bacteroides eggerthii]|uniref:Uncharacterized protein n=1 Tax=Bacteroides eggerthii TaxID=28111 RepID=A0A4Q5GWV1_9BACE|nr:hypothetical protein DW157_06605 [Bacteroides eggerthii]RYT73267.1 hypothetical protein EAJ03_10385 [Bacteroides eggerthii]